MKWPWTQDRGVEPTVRAVRRTTGDVFARAARLRAVAAEVNAATTLVEQNMRMLMDPGQDRRAGMNPAYAGPERRRELR